MWGLWDMVSQEEQWDSYNEASDGIPVLESDSDESVRFLAESHSPSIQEPGIITRATTLALPTYSSSGSDTSSSLGKSLITNICIYMHSVYNMQFTRFSSAIVTSLLATFWALFWQKAYLLLL